MRNDRFDPPSKSRFSGKSEKEFYDYGAQPVTHDIREFDLTDDGAFDIATLNPFHLRKYENLEAYPYIFEAEHDVLAWGLAYLCDSPTAHALIQHIEGTGWRFALSDLGFGGFHLNVSDKIIEIDNFGFEPHALGQSEFFKMSLIYIMAKALREIWHEDYWGSFAQKFNPESVLMLERARTADCDSHAVFIGWELRAAGQGSLWRFILSTEESDMAQVLTNILDRYPSALYNGMAMAHIFRQWYADEARIDAQDHAALEAFDDAIKSGDSLFGELQARRADFEVLSVMKDGIIYLKNLGDTVAKDPFFAGLGDSMNQAHLFQIIYDNKVTMVNGIPFRDPALARRFLNES